MVASSRALYTDPLRSFKFNVCIPQQVQNVYGIGGNTNMARLGFMSVQGLGVSIEPLTYREGGDNLTTRKMPGQADFNPITFSRGMFPQDNDNYNWLTNIFTAQGLIPNTSTQFLYQFRRNGTWTSGLDL